MPSRHPTAEPLVPALIRTALERHTNDPVVQWFGRVAVRALVTQQLSASAVVDVAAFNASLSSGGIQRTDAELAASAHQLHPAPQRQVSAGATLAVGCRRAAESPAVSSEVGGALAIVTAMAAERSSAARQRDGLSALRDLCSSGPDGRRAAVHADAVASIRSAMAAHRRDVAVQRTGMQALRALAVDSGTDEPTWEEDMGSAIHELRGDVNIARGVHNGDNDMQRLATTCDAELAHLSLKASSNMSVGVADRWAASGAGRRGLAGGQDVESERHISASTLAAASETARLWPPREAKRKPPIWR